MSNNKSSNRKKGKARKAGNPGQRKQRQQSSVQRMGNFQEVVVVPRSLGWAPRRVRVCLRYEVDGPMTNVGVAQMNIRFQPTYAYDVNPAIGGTAMPGFVEWGGIYRYYRVRGSTATIGFANQEAFTGTCCICPVNFDPTNNTANYQNYFSSKLSVQKLIGPLTGFGVCRLSNSCTTADFGGVPDTQQLDPYCATTTGSVSPANNYYWFIGWKGAAVGTAAGVQLNVVIDVDIEFFELGSPSA